MSANQDYKDLFRILLEEEVEYLLVGAHAVIFYSEPRYTKDIDIFINPTIENAKKVWRALSKFGAPLNNITLEDFTKKDLVYQIGIEPNRIDILMGIGPINFLEIWNNKQESTYDGIKIYIIGKKDLISAKEYSNRDQDLLDIKKLKK